MSTMEIPAGTIIEADTVTHGSSRRSIAVWLLCCCLLVFSMVVLGGVTRLTGSGLSMVSWRPVSGVIPPLSETEWSAEFERYKASPEYQKINRGIGLDRFKQIFWFEYAHRLLGRSVGIVFLIPFLYFLFRRRIDGALSAKLVFLFVLGGLEGLLGWYMVKSGLVDKPHVSQYRLTAHLAAAILIYGYMLWVALGLWFERERAPVDAAAVRGPAKLITALIVLTTLSGGFVAGLKAGLIHNTFPKMGGQWIPDGLLLMQPPLVNLFENPVTAQFNHRLLAMIASFSILALWFHGRRRVLPSRVRMGYHALVAVAIVQVALGVTTLLFRVPVATAAAHQGGALVLFSVAVYLNHALRRR